MKFFIKFLPRRKRWRLEYRNGRRVRLNFKTKALAEAEIERLRADVERAGAIWVEMAAAERNDLMAVVAEIKASGYTPRTVWDGFRSRAKFVAKSCPTMAVAITDFLQSKRTGNRSRGYIESLEHYLGMFARGRDSKLVSEMDTAEIEAWFASRNEASTTKASNLGRLSSFFNYCWRKRHITENPCDRVEVGKLEQKTPQILTPMQYARLLIGTVKKHPRILAWVVCGLIAGLRPEEMVYENKGEKEIKVGWKEIDFKHARIRVDAAASKVRARRIVHLEPSAVKWLQWAKKHGAELPVSENVKRRYVKRLRKLIHAKKWPQDILRHTAVSVLMAKYQDAGKVADELGNSASVLLRNYRDLIYKEIAQKLLEITPKRII
ncbi:MAG TPA: hypothetical protein VMH30_09280 [Verrucomicrobiae bacterium]|nr:hypothetical protein [Verrucomicrobiae bacterium]